MNITDIITILGNISQSLFPVQQLISGGAYLLGLLFFINGILKLKEVGERNKHTSMAGPVFLILIGTGLFYLPSTMTTLANTAFGVGNILTYASYNKMNIYNSIMVLLRTAGLIWFVRGSVLLVHSSEPGSKDGRKGLLFLIAGILAINIDNTIAEINTIISRLVSWTLNVKTK